MQWKGISLDRKDNKYRVRVNAHGHRYYLGKWVDPHVAARVYDRAAVLLMGHSAATNFGIAAALEDNDCPLPAALAEQLREIGQQAARKLNTSGHTFRVLQPRYCAGPVSASAGAAPSATTPSLPSSPDSPSAASGSAEGTDAARGGDAAAVAEPTQEDPLVARNQIRRAPRAQPYAPAPAASSWSPHRRTASVTLPAGVSMAWPPAQAPAAGAAAIPKAEPATAAPHQQHLLQQQSSVDAAASLSRAASAPPPQLLPQPVALQAPPAWASAGASPAHSGFVETAPPQHMPVQLSGLPAIGQPQAGSWYCMRQMTPDGRAVKVWMLVDEQPAGAPPALQPPAAAPPPGVPAGALTAALQSFSPLQHAAAAAAAAVPPLVPAHSLAPPPPAHSMAMSGAAQLHMLWPGEPHQPLQQQQQAGAPVPSLLGAAALSASAPMDAGEVAAAGDLGAWLDSWLAA